MLFFFCMDYVGGVNMSLRTANTNSLPNWCEGDDAIRAM